MMTLFNKHFLKAGGLLAALLVTLLTPGVGRADVLAGDDFFQTGPTSYWSLLGVPTNFQGVPIGTCTAGSCGNVSNGSVVGNTDTIVQRTNDVTTNGGITGLAIQALQLVDLNYFGAGINLYATLAGPQPTLTGGTMNGLAPNTMQIQGVTSGVQTFSSYLDFNVSFYESTSTPAAFNFTTPTNTGTLVGTSEIMLTAMNVAWTSIQPIQSFVPCPPDLIGCHSVGVADGVVTPIYDINGNLINTDFYPTLGGFIETAPEPSTFALFGAGLALFGYSRRKTAIRSKQSAA